MTYLRSKAIAGALRTAPCFSELSDVQISMLASGGEERRVPRYTVLYREGSAAHSFYVLLEGKLDQTVSATGQRALVVAPTLETREGVCFGYEGLSGGLRRLTTCAAAEECLMLHFSTTGLMVDEAGAAGLAAKIVGNVVAAALRGTQFFQGFSAQKIDDLAPLFKLEEYGQAGQVVYDKGGAADKLYLLLEGSLVLESEGIQVAVLPEEEDLVNSTTVFGESAVLSDQPRNFTARTLSPCKMLYVPRSKFAKLLALLPDIKWSNPY